MNKLINCFLSCALILFSVFSFAQEKKIDSLLGVLKNINGAGSSDLIPTVLGSIGDAKYDTILIKTLNDLAWQLKNNNPDTSIILSTQALNLSLSLFKEEKINSYLERVKEKCIAASYQNLGAFNWLKGNYPPSLNYFSKALKIREGLSDKKGISQILGSMGLVYTNQDDYPKALDYYLKALEISEELKDKKTIATHFGNIGIVYLDQRDYSKALNYYFKALKIDEELNDKNGLANNLANIGRKKLFPDSFILFKPKDIVSGDFYWYAEKNGKKIIAACDCTGHGVPGALMSMIATNILNQIVNEKQITVPSEILRLLNIGIYEALHQGKDGALARDGLDMALCCVDYENNQLQYAGAQNPLYVLTGNELIVIDGNNQTVGGGGFVLKKRDPLKMEYTNHIIPIEKNMSIFLFSDGYMDQFGGNERKKFGIQKFKELVLNNRHLTMQKQKELFFAAHQDWKGNTAQVDDILVIGVRL